MEQARAYRAAARMDRSCGRATTPCSVSWVATGATHEPPHAKGVLEAERGAKGRLALRGVVVFLGSSRRALARQAVMFSACYPYPTSSYRSQAVRSSLWTVDAVRVSDLRRNGRDPRIVCACSSDFGR